MQPEQKVPLGVAEAEALAAWLERAARDYSNQAQREPEGDPMGDHAYYAARSSEAREWARLVKPVPINDKKR